MLGSELPRRSILIKVLHVSIHVKGLQVGGWLQIWTTLLATQLIFCIKLRMNAVLKQGPSSNLTVE
jgi:uncharacterized membrane protein YjjP (DUF1212 family)